MLLHRFRSQLEACISQRRISGRFVHMVTCRLSRLLGQSFATIVGQSSLIASLSHDSVCDFHLTSHGAMYGNSPIPQPLAVPTAVAAVLHQRSAFQPPDEYPSLCMAPCSSPSTSSSSSSSSSPDSPPSVDAPSTSRTMVSTAAATSTQGTVVNLSGGTVHGGGMTLAILGSVDGQMASAMSLIGTWGPQGLASARECHLAGKVFGEPHKQLVYIHNPTLDLMPLACMTISRDPVYCSSTHARSLAFVGVNARCNT
jgi:hypothetical protein